jgi:hypothetical protein
MRDQRSAAGPPTQRRTPDESGVDLSAFAVAELAQAVGPTPADDRRHAAAGSEISGRLGGLYRQHEVVVRRRGRRRRLRHVNRRQAANERLARPGSGLPARREARPRRTGSAGDSRIGASSPSFSILESDWRKPRSAAISARSDRRISRENCGSAHSLQCAAASCIIHAGMQALDPSGCGMTTSSTPR